MVEAWQPRRSGSAIITGATGAEPVTSEERAFLGEHRGYPGARDRHVFGHTMEAQFPLGIALGRAFDFARRAVST